MSSTTTKSTTTLGPIALRKIVQNSPADIQKQSLDLGGIVWLEHLNLVVGDMDTAKKFYIDFLGFTAEREHNFKSNHYNVGQQQFHLAAATDIDTPQRITGSIGLTVPSLQRIRERVDVAQEELKDSLFSIKEDKDDKIMTVACPYGNVIHLYDISIDDEHQATTDDSTPKMVRLHSEGGDYGARMAVRTKPGIRYVEIACREGTCNSIAEFYDKVLECQVTKTDETAAICVGPGVHLVYTEHEDLSDDSIKQMKGVHACIYIKDFEKTYNVLKKRDIIWTNPRFTHLDSCDTWEEAKASRTFRFKDIPDMNTGEKILELEHETRPMMHGQYMKVPPYVPN